jgi:hypothetical protein
MRFHQMFCSVIAANWEESCIASRVGSAASIPTTIITPAIVPKARPSRTDQPSRPMKFLKKKFMAVVKIRVPLTGIIPIAPST